VIRRRLFAGVSAISLVLCLATVGLWIKGPMNRTLLESGDRTFMVSSYPPVVAIGYGESGFGQTSYRQILGFTYMRSAMQLDGSATRSTLVSTTFARLVLILAAAPFCWAILMARRLLSSRPRDGFCECGYNRQHQRRLPGVRHAGSEGSRP
jgi:hypothetical protein